MESRQAVLLIQALLSIHLTFSTALTTATSTSTWNHTSSTQLALPTTHYTGQSLLTGTCATPIYSTLHFSAEGSGQAILEVPLIGCSDDRLECCPSLQWPKWSSRSTWSGSRHSATATVTSSATSSNGGQGFADNSRTTTGIVSALNASPLSVCPSDFVNLSPVCCPTGYSLYPTALYGRVTPCYRSLATPISVPSPILASISSAMQATLTTDVETVTLTATASTTAPQATVDVVINQVFALGLPCAVAGDFSYQGLSKAAKAGIAATVVVFGVLGGLIALWWCWCMRTPKGMAGHSHISMSVFREGRGRGERDELRSGLFSSPGMGRGREWEKIGAGASFEVGGMDRHEAEGQSLVEMGGDGRF